MAAKKKVLNELPAELVSEILLKLPVKSLLRFSSVSKPWESIISASWFVKRYRGREKNIVISSWTHDDFGLAAQPLPVYSVSSLSRLAGSGSGVEASSNGLVVPEFEEPVTLLSFCDELWLVSSLGWNAFYLWNPSTRRHKKLPNPSIPSKYRSGKSVFLNYDRFAVSKYVLGYDSVGDDYKILKIPNKKEVDTHAELYSLKSDSWRAVANFPSNILSYRDGVFFSGKIHWLYVASVASIVCFDLSTEKFGEVVGPPISIKFPYLAPKPGPRPDEVIARKSYYASVLRGMLCVSVTDLLDDKCDIWMMEEYGVSTSWSIMFTIRNLGYNTSIEPLCILENGAILVHSYYSHDVGLHRIYVYVADEDGNGNGNGGLQQLTCGSSSGHCRITDHDDGFLKFGIVYRDSLVAPDTFNSTTSSSMNVKRGSYSKKKKRIVDGGEVGRRNKQRRTYGRS